MFLSTDEGLSNSPSISFADLMQVSVWHWFSSRIFAKVTWDLGQNCGYYLGC